MWALLGMLLLSVGSAAGQSAAPKRIVGYFMSWGIYARNYFVTDVAGDKLTHINYAFANISPEGECLLGDPWADVQFPYPGETEGDGLLGNFNQLNLLKAQHPQLQTLISIGGWTWSDRFSDVALTAEARQKFAASCVAFMKTYGFDGLDVDWEYPTGNGEPGNVERPEDPANFILLMAELRKQLDEAGAADGRSYLLTIATSANAAQVEQIDWVAAQESLDWINVMAYDFAGPWSETTGFNAPLYGEQSADTAIQAYLAAGIPADKLVLGVPFYGRGWKEVAAENDGLHQPYGSIPGGTYGEGVFEYEDISKFWVNYMTRQWDEAAQVPWLYSEGTGIMISYDDVESLQIKAAYVNEQGLGGVMFWELSADTPEHTLLSALDETLNGS